MKKYFPYFILSIILGLSVVFNIVLLFQFTNMSKNTDLVYNDYIYSIVEIKATKEEVGESFGTAEFINSDGDLITNAHVVTYKKLGEYYPFENFYIRFSFETEYRLVSLIKYDIDKDLAILQLQDKNCNFEALKIRDSLELSFNEKVYAIGNLNNLGLSITNGRISNPNINVNYENNNRNVIQCDITIADGNSGGALLDSNGNLIGITTFRLKDNKGNVIYGIAYCIPINTVMEYMESVKGTFYSSFFENGGVNDKNN